MSITYIPAELRRIMFEFDTLTLIIPKTDIGRVTARILGFNTENRVLERRALRTE